MFHEVHPQFVGYTRGKLHELVMKFYKSREFAAAINDVLDPWINAKQPKKEMEKTMHWKSGIGEVIFEFACIFSFHFKDAVGLSTLILYEHLLHGRGRVVNNRCVYLLL